MPGRGVRSLTLGKIPEGGLHIDVPRKTLGAWQAADTMGFSPSPSGPVERVADRVLGGSLRGTGGSLRGRSKDSRIGLSRRYRQRSGVDPQQGVSEFADGPAGQILELAKLLAPVRPGLVVSGDAVADYAVRPREAEWSRFVDACNLLRTVCAESA
jgi:hypothetical protein